MLQTELLIDNKALLNIIVDAIDCNVETIDVKEEVWLHYSVYYHWIVVSVYVHTETVDAYMQLYSLQEFP